MKPLSSLLALCALLTFPLAAQQSGLTAETWTGLTPGKSILILRKEGVSTRAPNTTKIVPSATVTGLPANSGTRLRGTLTPQVDDTYTFWVNGMDNVALWLSEDGSRFTKQLIANHLSSTNTTLWTRHRDQKSIPIALTAGTTYHIEAHVMSSVANGHLSIAWQGSKGNWALAPNGAIATQSSVLYYCTPDRAIDGKTTNIWQESAITANQTNSWFKVDFAETRPLNQIILFNGNSGTGQKQLSNFRISALDATGTVLSQADFFTTTGNAGNSFTWDMPAVVQAKSVKIQLLGKNLAGTGQLPLAEVQAFHFTPPPTNWALAVNGSTATQSSTSNSYLASLATDGITNGDLNAGSVTMTQDQADSSLEIDLGQDRPVNRVVLHNRDTLQSRLSNFRLSLLDSTRQVITTRDYFPATGNAGTILYWNLVNTVQARSIRIELLGQNLDANGYLSLAEVQAFEINPLLEARDFQVISAAYLGAVAPDPLDQNDNHLADAFEQSTGLATSALPGALLEHGDPDKDGMSNYEEQALGANPLLAESFGDVITREMWMDHTSGSTIASFVADRPRFLGYPNDIAQVAGIDANPGYTNYGARYRGSFIAPSTGTYHFWISSNNAELWLADGTLTDPANNQPLHNRFGKQRVATSDSVTTLRNFDQTSAQRSRPLTLIQGQRYYIEVLHKQASSNPDHVAVAWQTSGQPRTLMPAAVFFASSPEPADFDDDNLPDSWETTVGLNPANNGRTSTSDGQYADADADGLNNLQEYQNGTNPFAKDSDGDGIPDYDEIFLYGSDPAVSNNLATVTQTLPALNQYSAATGSWTTQTDGTLAALECRGAITYTFTLTEPGVHEVILTAGAISSTPTLTKSLPVELSIDDTSIVRKTLLSKDSKADTLRAITPWLNAGTHTVTVFHDNYSSLIRLRIDSLTLQRLGGTDLDENNIPDWIEQKETLANTLTRIPTHSRTSPVSIEGITRQLSTTTLTATAQPVTLHSSINDSFFADIPLSETATTPVQATFLGGILSEPHDITWLPTNLLDSFTNNTLHIRQGDALRLTAHDPAENPTGSFTLQGSVGVPPAPTEPQSSAQPHTLTFDTAGTHTLTATWTPASGPAQSATLTIVVHSATFGPSHLVQVGIARNWTPLVLGASHQLEADSRLAFGEIVTTTGPRQFKVSTLEAANRHVIARLPGDIDGAPSAILARGTVQAFHIANVTQTQDAAIVTRYPDGTWLMHNTLVAVNLPPNIIVRLTPINQGTLFTNGTNTLDLTSADFDANGIAQVYYEWAGTGTPSMCHNVQLFLAP